ncbi:MAG: KH domain-containing protein [Clostridia bacterium]
MIEAVRFIIEHLVDNKQDISITSSLENGVETITVKVAPGDVGKVIGKKGKIVTAIRTIFKAAGIKNGQRYAIEIAD